MEGILHRTRSGLLTRYFFSSMTLRIITSWMGVLGVYRLLLFWSMVYKSETIYQFDPTFQHPLSLFSLASLDGWILLFLWLLLTLLYAVIGQFRFRNWAPKIAFIIGFIFVIFCFAHYTSLAKYSAMPTFDLMQRISKMITWREIVANISFLSLLGFCIYGTHCLLIWKWKHWKLWVGFSWILFLSSIVLGYLFRSGSVTDNAAVTMPPGLYQSIEWWTMKNPFPEYKSDPSFPQEGSFCIQENPTEPQSIGLPSFKKKKILFIIIESFSEKWFLQDGVEGWKVTPFLAKKYREGWRLQNHYASGNATWKSHFSLFTGCYPEVSSVAWKNSWIDGIPQRLGIPGFIVTPVSTLYCRPKALMQVNEMKIIDYSFLSNSPQAKNNGFSARSEFVAVDRFLKEFSQNDQPMIGIYSTYLPHAPYIQVPGYTPVPIEKNEKNMNTIQYRLYLNSLRAMDAAIEKLFEGLERTGQLQETLVFITGDHGQTFDRGFFTHGNWMFEEILKVPAFFWVSEKTTGSTTHLTSHADLAPTLMDFLERPYEPQSFQGSSWYRPLNRSEIFNSGELQVASISSQGIKIVADPVIRSVIRWDLKQDPLEKKGKIADPEDPQVQRLIAYYQRQSAYLQELQKKRVDK